MKRYARLSLPQWRWTCCAREMGREEIHSRLVVANLSGPKGLNLSRMLKRTHHSSTIDFEGAIGQGDCRQSHPRTRELGNERFDFKFWHRPSGEKLTSCLIPRPTGRPPPVI
jgi:hypothetical protein